jgi:hypothetical protein
MELTETVTNYQPRVVTDADYIFLDNFENNQEQSQSNNYQSSPEQIPKSYIGDATPNSDYLFLDNSCENNNNNTSTLLTNENPYESTHIKNRIQLKNDLDDVLDTTDTVLVIGDSVHSENPVGSPIVPINTVGKIIKIRHRNPGTPNAYILYSVLFKNFADYFDVINVFTSNNIEKCI